MTFGPIRKENAADQEAPAGAVQLLGGLRVLDEGRLLFAHLYARAGGLEEIIARCGRYKRLRIDWPSIPPFCMSCWMKLSAMT